ncbi:zinc/manganese transport system substrate-binding protein [Motilibacter rhizosphaerae]|uniref:Zinc/manganese transport system substrate-binding protein n=1 Tax=Motilibacter rhizosphaerae TaxID=598652 RepID=A0A4Q7NRF5_9ACTN|nr:zinc/manganese transport system substrate-binding protein [Motilibacter rhizosphaerae]
MLAALLACASCASSGAASGATPAADGGPVRVVASTNVWGDVVRQVAGDRASVVSLISDPDQDPHSYEADAKVQLALAKAQVVVENGGGYDDFVRQMLASAGGSRRVIDAVEVSGKTAPPGGELNEHVWYDLPTVEEVATAVATALSATDPAGATAYQQGATRFIGRLHDLEQRDREIGQAHAGEGVGITEPVPGYLLAATGLVDRTPHAFSEAVEEGTDVSPAVLHETLELYSRKRVAVLVYNAQTTGTTTERVLAAARSAGVPVVPVTETLPAGQDFLTWMGETVSRLGHALDGT